MRIWDGICRFVRRISLLEVHIYAAYAAYFWILAIFPAMMLLISIIQYTPISPADLQELLRQVVPGSLQALTDYMIEELFAVNSTAVLSLSAVVALWSASRGVLSLHKGLNRVYVARETRNPLLVRARCLLYTLAGLLALVLILGLHLLSRDVIDLLMEEGNALGVLLLELGKLRSVLTAGLLTLFFAAMYSTFPNRKAALSASLPGAAATAVLWVLFSRVFTFYVERFGNYSLYYGSLSVIALAMLWLYVCIFLFYCGGILNRELERRAEQRKQRLETRRNQRPPAKPN